MFCTWPRFKTEDCGISEMAYWSRGYVQLKAPTASAYSITRILLDHVLF